MSSWLRSKKENTLIDLTLAYLLIFFAIAFWNLLIMGNRFVRGK